MKIAFFMTTILEKGGGLEKYLIETASYFSNILGIRVDIITMDEKFTRDYISILNFYYLKRISTADIYKEPTHLIMNKLGKAGYLTVKNFEELKNKLNEYDVIYSKNEIVEAFIFKFFIGYKNIPPIIFGVHTPHHYPITKSIQSKMHNFLYEGWVYNFFCSGIKAFHTSNKDSFERLSKQFPTKNVYLIHYPFDIEKFSRSLVEKDFEIIIDKNKFNILWLARLMEQKGVDDLIRLIEEINLLPLSEKIFWHIGGSGQPNYENDLIKLSKKFSNVKFYGHVKNTNVPFILKNMSLFISTSKWEVSPFNIMEAQSIGVPVLSFKIPGPEDIVIDKKTGILVEDYNQFYNSLIDTFNGKYKFINVEKNIRNKFSPELIYSKLVRMFENINK
jgi:glycosyltransferase involved in cell wall biosynthesis